MPKHDFIPKSDPGMAAFLRNLANKIGGYATTFGLTPAEVVSVVWDYKTIYRISDKHVGQFSDPISVTVTKQVGH